MKNTYVKPEMQVEEFLAENFCSSTCTSGEKYLFTCNAGGGTYGGLYVPNGTEDYGHWEGNGWNSHWVKDGTRTKYSRVSNGNQSYHACNDTHEVDVNDTFTNGIFDPDTDHFNGNEVNCLIWYKNGKYKGHASTALSTEQWTIVKS